MCFTGRFSFWRSSLAMLHNSRNDNLTRLLYADFLTSHQAHTLGGVSSLRLLRIARNSNQKCFKP